MLTDLTRPPVFAERGWYPNDVETLNLLLDELLVPVLEPVKARAVIAPHAGYKYSGAVAGQVFAAVDVPKSAILLGPAHSWIGSRFAIMTEGSWELPMGTVPIHEELAALLQSRFPSLHHDVEAHHAEHALELQLPFLLRRQPALQFVPIRLGDMTYEKCEETGLLLAEILREFKEDVLIVVSSDMHHHEQSDISLKDSVVQEKDALAIAQMEQFNPAGLFQVVREEEISMCGVVPATIAMIAARNLGATHSKVLAHRTSADITGDYSYVVGYAGCIIY